MSPHAAEQNRLARLRDLRDKKHREDAGLFVIEGGKVVGELLAAGFRCWKSMRRRSGWILMWAGCPHPAKKATSGGTRPAIIQITAARNGPRASHFPTPSSVLAVGKISRPPLGAGALNKGLTLAL